MKIVFFKKETYCVANDVLQEDLEHTTRLLVDEPRDALDSATARQATDCRLGDALDVVAQHFAMALGSPLSETFASLSTAGHCWLRASCGELRKSWRLAGYSAGLWGKRLGRVFYERGEEERETTV